MMTVRRKSGDGASVRWWDSQVLEDPYFRGGIWECHIFGVAAEPVLGY